MLSDEQKKQLNSYNLFIVNYQSSGLFDSQDFTNQNCEVWHQKNNKDNRILVTNHWLQSRPFDLR